MRVGFLTGKLMSWVEVTIVDHKTKKVLWIGAASEANFNDTVKDWDFSKEHIIYI